MIAGIRNAWLGENQPPYKPSDFKIDWEPELKPADPQSAMEAELENLMIFKQGYERQLQRKKELAN